MKFIFITFNLVILYVFIEYILSVNWNVLKSFFNINGLHPKSLNAIRDDMHT